MYGLKLPSTSIESVMETLLELEELRHLDVSEMPSEQNDHLGQLSSDALGKIRAVDLLASGADSFPNLVSLDVSGKEGIATASDLLPFLDSHPKMRFLGLVLTDACKDDVFVDEANPNFNPRLLVSGSATESQVSEALRRYVGRQHYTHKSLYNLFRLTQGWQVPRADLIQLVIRSANHYRTVLSIQMAVTACLFNLSKGEIGQKLHPKVLGDIVSVDLNAMEEFPQHQQLQKNVLLTICSDRILQEVSFERYRCARLVMECLCQFHDQSMNRMSVAICSILGTIAPISQS